MKKYVLGFVMLAGGLVVTSLNNGIDNTKIIETEIFTVEYSEEYEQPLNLTYWVQCPGDGVSRKGLDFYEVEGIHTSDDDDYYNNVWDKGHLAPAASFNCDRDMLKKTFSYLNCALQHERLNRGPWRFLEGYERELALSVTDTVWVRIDVHFETDSVLPTGARVPSSFSKVIKYGDSILTYKFPNEDVKGRDWREFKVID
jgi:DNA/RNA endonuclease G (NUC1)